MSEKSQEKNMRKLAELLSHDLGYISLIGMWTDNGIHIQLSQSCFGADYDVLYRTTQHSRDYTGGQNHWLTRCDLAQMSYVQLLNTFLALRKGGASHERAA